MLSSVRKGRGLRKGVRDKRVLRKKGVSDSEESRHGEGKDIRSKGK